MDTIVLDKTGTVTEGRMQLVEVVPAAGVSEDALLRFAGAVEDASEHPIAAAIAAGARQRLGSEMPTVEGFVSTQGLGASGVVAGRSVVVGRRSWLADQSSRHLNGPLAAACDHAESAGRTVVTVGWDGTIAGLLVIGDAESRPARRRWPNSSGSGYSRCC